MPGTVAVSGRWGVVRRRNSNSSSLRTLQACSCRPAQKSAEEMVPISVVERRRPCRMARGRTVTWVKSMNLPAGAICTSSGSGRSPTPTESRSTMDSPASRAVSAPSGRASLPQPRLTATMFSVRLTLTRAPGRPGLVSSTSTGASPLGMLGAV